MSIFTGQFCNKD